MLFLAQEQQFNIPSIFIRAKANCLPDETEQQKADLVI